MPHPDMPRDESQKPHIPPVSDLNHRGPREALERSEGRVRLEQETLTPQPRPPREGKAGAASVYSATVNLAETPFPMKADLLNNERLTRARWREMDLYGKILNQRMESPPFSIHDGPPFPNGPIHLGHVLNKCLKDFALKAHSMSGRATPYVPGWDCHGLPIEQKVLDEIAKDESRAVHVASLTDVDRQIYIRGLCRSYAEKNVMVQRAQMEHLLTFADYDHCYRTMDPAMEASCLRVLAALKEEGVVYHGEKPVYWSLKNQTALAEAELEYKERTDTAAYVKFPVAAPRDVLSRFGITEDIDRPISLLAWTTTPWTLPANLAVAVHPHHDYVLLERGGELLVVGKDRVTDLKGEVPSILATAAGEMLKGVSYLPLFECAGPPRGAFQVLLADYIRSEQGTGLVHIAPGHGIDDYVVGSKNGLSPYSPVTDEGRFDSSVPEFLQGGEVLEMCAPIIEDLSSRGLLLSTDQITHSCPVDWRSKTPVICRTTKQWFIGVDIPTSTKGVSLRELALKSVDSEIGFRRASEKKRLRGMIEGRPDWCISRQRSWGVPIPAFRTRDGLRVMTPASIRAVANVVSEEGTDAWYTKSPRELLRDYDQANDPDFPPGIQIDELAKDWDIMDVWLESGSTWSHVIHSGSQGSPFPVDFYIEGSDQHRGWFQSSLLTSLLVTGKAPYRSLVTHGFLVDKDGRKLSKSKGDTIDALFKRYGSDVLRWWVASVSYEDEVKIDPKYFEDASQSYRKVRNVVRFMLANTSDFAREQLERYATEMESLPPTSLHAWVLNQVDELTTTVREGYSRLDFRHVHVSIFDFCNETLSSIYLAAIKDSLYCDGVDSRERRLTQRVLYDLADRLIHLLAPILSHTAEEAYLVLHNIPQSDRNASVHIEDLPTARNREIDSRWPLLLQLRAAVQKKLEAAKEELGLDNSLDAGIELPSTYSDLQEFGSSELSALFGVSQVRFSESEGEPRVVDLRHLHRCERSWRRDGTVRRRSDGGLLSDRDARVLGLDPMV